MITCMFWDLKIMSKANRHEWMGLTLFVNDSYVCKIVDVYVNFCIWCDESSIITLYLFIIYVAILSDLITVWSVFLVCRNNLFFLTFCDYLDIVVYWYISMHVCIKIILVRILIIMISVLMYKLLYVTYLYDKSCCSLYGRYFNHHVVKLFSTLLISRPFMNI